MTRLTDIINPQDLQRGIHDGFIRTTGVDDLLLYTHTVQAVIDRSSWDNPAVRMARGIIVQGDTVIARPFPKFFNYHEPTAPKIGLDDIVSISDKMDGSLGILYHYNGEQRVATKGSLQAEQAIEATGMLRDMDVDWPADITPLVEIIYPENRIVINYGARRELCLIGAVSIADGTIYTPRQAHAMIEGWPTGQVAETRDNMRFGDVLSLPTRPNAEGWVVSGPGGMVKVKQEDYIRLHKIITGLSTVFVWEHLTNDGDLLNLLETIPDEMHNDVTKLWNNMIDQRNQLLSDIYHDFRNADKTDRRSFALSIHGSAHRSALFSLLDNNDEALYRYVNKLIVPQHKKFWG